MALTLAGCTEGLAKLLRPKMNASESQQEQEWSKHADDLADKIRQLEGPNELKNRAVNAVLQTKGASTGVKLKALQEGGIITPDQLKAFNNIRNRVMHGELVSPYSNEKGDNQLSHLLDVARALTRELLNRPNPG
jgi:hypothetical protein